jgi:hypothetical protein
MNASILNLYRDAEDFSHEVVTDDYAWRFELIRSTLEDLDQLIEDETPVATAGEAGVRAPAARARDIPVPSLTLPRLRLAAMNA